MFPADGNGGESNALDLARQDFARTLGPSVARGGALHARPIAIAMCSETANESRAARHLAEDVEVPAVVGFRSMSGALQVIPTELLPNHVLSIVSISQVPQVTRIPEPPGEPRLVWRTTLDYESVALPLARFVSESLEPLARSNGLGTRPFRVAAVLSKAINHDFVDAFFRALRFNGKSALENGSDFRQFALDNDDGAAPHEDVVRALLDFAPAVVYYAGSGFFPKGFASLEARWRQRLRPTYVTVSGLDPALLPLVGRDASRRHRFFAVTNLATTVTNAELVLRYNMAHPEEPVERSSAPQPSYDAFYVLAYATHAVGRGPITGPALSAAIDRLLPPGRPIDVGPASIYEGFGALRAGEGIDLRGAIGSLDFDRATGEAPIDYAITCFGADRDGVATAQSDSGLVYDARTDQLVGKLRCP
jgi:branched-chain amino acid transport system substrate-binding protein